MAVSESIDTEGPTRGARARHDPYAALRRRDFRLLVGGTFLAGVGQQMLGVAIGWDLYRRTHAPLALGLVGLVEVVPVLLLALPAGQIVDRSDRKRIVVGAMLLLSLGAAGLVRLAAGNGPLPLIYGCLLLIGIGRAFESPATAALLAQVVPPADFGSAATWESSAWQTSSILGPALGGVGIALGSGAAPVYAVTATLALVVALLWGALRPRPVARAPEPASRETLLAGLRFVWCTKEILAAITLDMVAVLLGGATALLPIFATDVLGVGAAGLGLLRAAPAIGAVLAAVVLAHRPPFRRAGWTLLTAVAGFGLATILFGLSRLFPLSLLALGALGALDNISVVIRSTLLLTRTPDAMRGRVNAVHYVFIGLSNELGAFESGVAAAVLGAVGAVVAGGIGTLLVVPLIALAWPQIRRLRRLHAPDA